MRASASLSSAFWLRSRSRKSVNCPPSTAMVGSMVRVKRKWTISSFGENTCGCSRDMVYIAAPRQTRPSELTNANCRRVRLKAPNIKITATNVSKAPRPGPPLT